MLAIGANTNPPQVGSVSFVINNGPTAQVTNTAPYLVALAPTAGSYTLTATPYTQADATGTAGSASSLSFTVVTTPLVLLKPHKLFSPNGDGVDDYWQVEGIEQESAYQVVIFDRYGNKVYQAQPYATPWDGTQAGKPLAQGAYFYVIRKEGKQNIKTGSITLVK